MSDRIWFTVGLGRNPVKYCYNAVSPKYCQFPQQTCTNFMQTYLYSLISTHFFILTTNFHWLISTCFFISTTNLHCSVRTKKLHRINVSVGSYCDPETHWKPTSFKKALHWQFVPKLGRKGTDKCWTLFVVLVIFTPMCSVWCKYLMGPS